jgi:segregation and condensation protein A
MDDTSWESVADATDVAGTPQLALDGFSGPLALLLELARLRQIDLAHLPVVELVDQLVAALQQAGPAIALAQKGDWVVMASWLLLLRSRLLLPAEAAAQQAAAEAAGRLRDDLLTLQAAQTLTRWLESRPQLGRDVFARGVPELLGTAVDVQHAVDAIEFLWASMALFDDGTADPDTTPAYRPRWFDLHTVDAARERILRLLAAEPDGAPLAWFVSGAPEGGRTSTAPMLRQRSAWTSTFLAGLELARQGEVVLAQADTFSPIHLRSASAVALSDGALVAGRAEDMRLAPA